MGMTLPPLLERAKVREYRRGRFPLQLDLPQSSTLTENEINKVLSMASWEVPPSELAAGYEGLRGVLIHRDQPITRGSFSLSGLQIGGIGYVPFSFTQEKCTIVEQRFLPPTTNNFIERIPDTMMGTTYAKGGQLVPGRPSYRATGTYTASELAATVTNTDAVSRLPLTKLVVPHVEAYGRYLDSSLSSAEGPFGFIVLPIPSVKTRRISQMIVDILASVLAPDANLEEGISVYNQLAMVAIVALGCGLRDLHEHGSVHLQPHLENAYLFNGGTPYLTDWTTRRVLDGDPTGNLYNRALDLKRPADDYILLLQRIVPSLPDHLVDAGTISSLELALECYLGDQIERSGRRLYERAMRRLGAPASDLDTLAQGLMDAGIEGFPKNDALTPSSTRPVSTIIPTQSKRISGSQRNAPCPCGSEKKFKKCCGH